MSLTNAELTQAVEELRDRVADLEAGDPTEPRSSGAGWLIDQVASGTVAYGGRVSLPGTGDIVWQLEHRAADVLDADLELAAAVLGALGHPLRLKILCVLLEGARTLADLQQIPGAGTTGQLHHHLRELRSAGLVTSLRRNDYSVPAERVVPIVVMLQAALGRDIG